MKKQFVGMVFLLFDLLFIVVFYYMTIEFRSQVEIHGVSFTPYLLKDFSLFFVIIMLSLFYEKIYTIRFDFWEEAKLSIKALLLSFVIVLAILMLTKTNQEYSRSFFVIYFLGLMIFLPAYKRVLKKILFKMEFFRKKVKIVGDKKQAGILAQEFRKNWYLGFRSVKKRPDVVFIASRGISTIRIDQFLRRYSLFVKDIYVIPYMNTINFSQSQIIEFFNIKTSVIKIENNLLKVENRFLKELFDKSLVILILPLFLLFHIVISFFIKRDSSGDVLFKQNRVGKDKKIFQCFKYRTMFTDNDDILKEYLKKNPDEVKYYKKYHKYKQDPRVTKIGKILRKLSLDELPQIINVLRGEMDLIGPRPYMPNEESELGEDLDLIVRVRPGISGLWQVSGRNNLSFNDRKTLDVWYIQNWSLWMDVIILFKTIKVVLLKTGAK